MSNVKHILLPTDGSPSSLKAAAFAADLAHALQARVSVLIVHPNELLMPPVWGVGEWPVAANTNPVAIEEIRDAVEKAATANELAATVKALGQTSAKVTPVQRWGHAAETICAYAADEAVDLIVIGSRGRSTFTRLLLGSVTSQVASHATVPVTIVR